MADVSNDAPVRTLAIVLNFNGGPDLVRCVASVPRDGATDVLVIDNASQDDSIAQLEAAHPDVEVLRLETNEGFCVGNNRGLALAVERGYDAALLLNDDIELHPDALDRMRIPFRLRETIAVVGPKVLYDPERDTIWAAGGALDYRQNLNRLIGNGRRVGEFPRSATVDYVPGCAMLIRVSALEAIGLLAPGYFAYLEDVEFCHRARAAGFSTHYEASAHAYHRASRVSGARYSALRKYLNARNSVHFLRQHARLRHWAGFFTFDVLPLPFVWLARALRGDGRAVRAKWRGIRAGFRGETGAPPADLFATTTPSE